MSHEIGYGYSGESLLRLDSILVGMQALGEFHANVNNSNYTAQADMGTSVANLLFTVFGYFALTFAAIALLGIFRNL